MREALLQAPKSDSLAQHTRKRALDWDPDKTLGRCEDISAYREVLIQNTQTLVHMSYMYLGSHLNIGYL